MIQNPNNGVEFYYVPLLFWLATWQGALLAALLWLVEVPCLAHIRHSAE